MAEVYCGEIHHWILEARACTLKNNTSIDDFGSMSEGVNLWWGEKFTGGKLNNIGYVIGLRNDIAGIGWRLDYDAKKGGHINQMYRIRGQKRWGKIIHPIVFGTFTNDSWYPPEFWVARQWYLWTEHHYDKMPIKIAEELKRFGINRMAHPVW